MMKLAGSDVRIGQLSVVTYVVCEGWRWNEDPQAGRTVAAAPSTANSAVMILVSGYIYMGLLR